jgi:hypothetical protein
MAASLAAVSLVLAGQFAFAAPFTRERVKAR